MCQDEKGLCVHNDGVLVSTLIEKKRGEKVHSSNTFRTILLVYIRHLINPNDLQD